MQPQAPPPANPYDFLLDQEQKPKKSLLPNMSGPVLVLGAGIVFIILIIIISALFLGKNKTSSGTILEVIGRAQEISRINTLEQPQLKDAATADLLATAQLALISEQTQLNDYAKTHKIKINPKKLEIYQNSQTDAQLHAAAQSNTLDSAYKAYLQQALNEYSDSLGKAYQGTKKPELQAILKEAYNSTQTLLGKPPKSS
jgi:hypothetical protein